MIITTTSICKTVEENVSGTHCFISPIGDQIAVVFDNRPDIVIHLLTPYYQKLLKSGKLTENDVDQMIEKIQNISTRKAWTDAIIDDLNETMKNS